MLFFVRDDTFSQVFEAVRRAKPKKLYLFQDGPRAHRPDDMENILRCRKICENIDWDCEVFRNYQEKNLGCDTSQFTAFSWVFDNEEKAIILEDDVVPSQSFFKYCDELLEKYKEDKEVFMICGRNQLGQTNYDDNSYFFAKADSIWGWASWRDRWALCDHMHKFLDDEKLVTKVKNAAPTRYDGEQFIKLCQRHRAKSTEEYVASFETPIRAAMHLLDKVSIIPRVNLIQNVGITGNSEHTSAGLDKIPKKQRQLYTITGMELDFPLVHPSEKVEHNEFLVERLKLMGKSSAVRNFFHRLNGWILRKIKK